METQKRQFRLRLIALGAVGIALLWALLLGPVAPAWTSPLQSPHRQTVPMTPPPTWTPVVQPGDNEPATAPRPTILPTVEPAQESGDGGSAGDGKLGGTPKGEEPTQELTLEPVLAVPWLEIGTDAVWIEPDQDVEIRVTMANLGNAQLDSTTVQASVPSGLTLADIRVSAGDATQANDGSLVWRTPELAPGQEITLELALATSPSLWPGTVLVVQAQSAPAGHEILIAQQELVAPDAILPQAGNL